MEELDKVFAGEAPEPIEPVVTPEPELVVEAPAPEPVAPEVQEPAPAKPEPGYVPLAVVLDTRDKLRAAENRIREFESRQQAPTAPDPVDDPEAFNAYYGQQLQQALQQQKVQTSYVLAVKDHGQDKVEEARQWALEKAQRDPVFSQQLEAAFGTETLPLDWVVQQHKRDALLAEVGDNVDDWFTREAAKRGYAPQSAPAAAAPVPVAATPAPKPAMPPRSIASDATPVRTAPSDNPMASLDAIFSQR